MIQDSVNKVVYEGNGEATEFFYPFEITKNTDVKVMIVSPEGAETILTNDYYVDVERGTVVYPGWVSGEEPSNQGDFSPLADGWKLVVYREVDYTQEVSMFDQYPFKVIEKMIDKNTILAQQLKEVADRSLKFSIAQAIDGVDMTVPYEAGKSFRWHDTEKKLVLTEDPAYVRRIVENLSAQVQEQSSAAVTSAQTASAAASSAVAANENAVNAEAKSKLYMETTKGYMETTEGYMNSASSSATKAAASESASYKNSLSASTHANNAAESATASNKSATASATSAETANTKAVQAVEAANAAEASAEKAAEAATTATAGQMQADWNETDTTSKAYIKNAPKFLVVSERIRGDDEPTYGVTSELLISDGTLATEDTVLSVNVEDESYAVSDQYSVKTTE
ncbi:MAG: hypothetical protein IJZ69_04235 [Bacteroidales bacterium]|nr:hypothetical protein [Bacteroidales bacterium]MBQ8809522.1 hypothetical protein [Bacteroidales bacterium]